jgi:uncharacterized protein
MRLQATWEGTGRSSAECRWCCLGWAAALALLSALVVMIPADGALAQPKFPELTGRVVDNAGLLTPQDKAAIEAELKAIEDKSTDQVVVVTLPDLGGYAIDDYGYQLGRHWKIGQKDKDNGAVLIVAPNERKVRIETGRGLEAHLTDAMSRIIIENAILPKFRRGDFSGGIRDGVRDIKATIEGDAEAVKERARGRVGEHQEVDYTALIMIAVWIAIIFYVVYQQRKYAQQFPQSANAGNRRRRRRSGFDDGSIIVIPGGSSDWGGGWSGGGGGWGGGGGGDFGGGGASGSW